MRQKLFFLIIALSTFLYAEAYDFQSGNLCYNITSNSEPYTVEVTYQNYWSTDNYSGKTTITIPETVTYGKQTYSVTSIGEYAFCYCSGLTSVTIPNSVTSIGDHAFRECTGLTSVTIPNSVTSIGVWVFGGCSGLTSVTIPNSVTSIGMYAFRGCSGLTSVNIPNSVTSIGAWAFGFYCGLTSLTIPNSVTSIGGYAFYYCSGLTSVTISNSVTSIGDYAFYGCSGLTSLTIPNSVTSIGDYAFDRCSGLKSVMVNWEEPLSISSNVFGRLTLSGISLYVPNSVKAKYEAADVWKEFNIVGVADFEVGGLYYNITSDTEPYTVEVTSDDYSGMTIATIPETVTYNEHAYSVTSIGSSAFEDCSGLTSVTIPNSVISIGGYAFNGCSGLESVNIPNSVTSIGDGAFAYCSGLTSIDVDSDNSNFTSVDGVLFNKDKTILICCPAGKTGSYTIPNSVTSIGDWAFFSCSGLTSVTIPNSVTSIGKYAFDRCSGLKSVMVNWEEPLSISSDVFGGLTLSDISLYVPNSVKAKYEAADVWKEFNIYVGDYEVKLSAENGTVTGSGIYLENTTVGIEAIPAEHYHFVRWSDENTENPREITVTEDLELEAIFEKDVPTAIKAVEAENNKTIKTIKDGQIVIIRNGVMYDLNGREL